MALQWGGRTWAPDQLKAFQAYLAKRGVSYGQWAGNHPGAAAGTFGLTGSPDDALAGARADASLAPLRADIQSQRKETATQGKSLLANNEGLYEALANILKGAAPATEHAYEGAAGGIAGLAKGFSSDMASTQAADKGTLDSFLQGISAPQAQVDQANAHVGGKDAQDVSYGLGGYIPASSLLREGAAFTSAAGRLPAQAAGQGIENAREINANVLDQDKQYADQLKQLSEKYPELRSQELQAILEARRAQEALDIQRQYLGQSQRKTGAEVTGYDPVTGLPTPAAIAAATRASTKADTAATKARDKKATATGKAVAKREDAFASARNALFDDAKRLLKTTKVDPVDWVLAHPGKKLADAPPTQATHPDYVTAKKALFNQYKSLLRFGTQSGQYKLKRRLNQMIDEALAAQGIVPAKPKKKSPPKAGYTNPKTGFTPGVTDYGR